MRQPLIVLISIYTVSILGFVLIPGQDDLGNPWQMDFFHAFYFVSFMGSTIGFGEIPYPFTDAQRLWTTFALYSTVISWLYAIGSLLSIMQSRHFQQVVQQASFRRSVQNIDGNFYIICGYGEMSNLLLIALLKQDIHVVVIDVNQQNIDNLEINNFSLEIPALCADASDPDTLLAAGIHKNNCNGVLALTSNDEVNLMVAIASKLICPEKFVISRAENQDSEANMASFGTDYIVNPYTSFADRLSIAIQSPYLFLLIEWITDDHYRANDIAIMPPQGRWIICGYGRFGKAFEKYLRFVGCEVTIIEAEPKKTNAPDNSIVGRGTEAITLREAKIKDAVGIIAGTNNDANNLSIIMTAQEMNSDLFCIARQNHGYNKIIFDTAKCHWLMQPGSIVARKVLTRINTPLLFDFLRLARHENEETRKILVDEIAATLGETRPAFWSIKLNQCFTPAFTSLSKTYDMQLGIILNQASPHTRKLSCIPLLLHRKDEFHFLPKDTTTLKSGDTVLYCGNNESEFHMREALCDVYQLIYLLTGEQQPRGTLLRKLKGLPAF